MIKMSVIYTKHVKIKFVEHERYRVSFSIGFARASN